MKTIIFGTTNPAKLVHIQAALEPLKIKVNGLAGIEDLPEIEENGKTPEENAEKKAVSYARAINQSVLSMDIALYLDGVSEDEQPGMHARRIPGHSGKPTDEELTAYYSGLFKKYGGRVTGHWKFAVCLAWPDGQTKSVMATTEERIFTSKVCSEKMPGYPLESMQIDQKTGKYVVQMTKQEQDQFWFDSIGKELQELFKDY